MNSPEALSHLKGSLASNPEKTHLGTIAACLAYRAFPKPGDPVKGDAVWNVDEKFFLKEAVKGNWKWLGNLMADHTALDWRASITATFGPESGSETKVLVVTSTRSGCFPAAGPLAVVGLVNGEKCEKEGRAKGIAVEWGGHWCYWEDPERFNKLCLRWLEDGEVVDEA